MECVLESAFSIALPRSLILVKLQVITENGNEGVCDRIFFQLQAVIYLVRLQAFTITGSFGRLIKLILIQTVEKKTVWQKFPCVEMSGEE